MKLSLCCWLAVACGCFADEAPVIMGSDWFAKLRGPKTRVVALYQMEKAGAGKGGKIEDFEEFSAGNRRVMVFPCPQPGHPDAWAVVNPATWKESYANLRGRKAEEYEPHPLEIERRRKWDAEMENPPADFKPWRPGEPWFDTLSGELVDPSGRKLGGFAAHPGILADFNGDGMLDLLAIQRMHIKVGEKKESVIDCVSISPLDSEKPGYAAVYANLRANDYKTPRSWRFAVRGESGGPRLVLVPEDRNKPEITFGFQNGSLTAMGKLPEDVLLDAHPEGDDSWSASVHFLKAHGHDMRGVGSDDSSEVLADFPAQPGKFSFKSLEIQLPETGDADPREAARLLAGHVFDNAFYRSQYQLASIGDPAKPATRGWLEFWCDGGGWSLKSVDLWWIDGDKAERWKQRGFSTFDVSQHSAADLGRRIAVAHEIDRIRTVPVRPFPTVADHGRSGGDDFPAYRVRAATQSPEITTTVFETCTPDFWQWIGPQYDRGVSSLIATLYVAPKEEKITESRDIRTLAPVWLDPERVSTVPPGLARAAVVAIGINCWTEMKPLLETLQAKLGPPSEDEKRLASMEKAENGWFQRHLKLQGREEWLAEKEHNTMRREMRDLAMKLTGDIRYELRRPITDALKNLKAFSSKPKR